MPLRDTATTTPPFARPVHWISVKMMIFPQFSLVLVVQLHWVSAYLHENVEWWHSAEVCSQCSVAAAPSLQGYTVPETLTQWPCMLLTGQTQNQQECKTCLKPSSLRYTFID